MNIVGIIAEYNPFHLGHEYHIQEARNQANADYVIAIISGSFVQRGSCAIADKYSRAKAALSCGADLVLELPVIYALSSAELFAEGSVAILNKLGIISHLAFGSECTDIHSIKNAAEILASEPKPYRESLKKALSQGLSFPTAREQALRTHYPDLCTSLSLNQPNTILGIEYCKALYQFQSKIHPVLIQRKGGSYHQEQQDKLFSSATSIRKQILDAEGDCLSSVISQLPAPSMQALKASYQYSFPLYDEDFSALVRYALLNVPQGDYTPYLDVSEDLANRIRRQLFAYESFHQFASLLKTKELTYSRICRCLLHILLGITKEHLAMAKSVDYVPYFRILGMKSHASKLLGMIGTHSSVPIVTNPADYLNRHASEKNLSVAARQLLELDCHATHIFNGIAGEKFHHETNCEYTRRFLKL